MRTLVPLRWHIIVRDLGNVKKIKNVIVPDQVYRDYEARYGEIVAIGPECFTGKFSCLRELVVGDLVAYGQLAKATVPIRWEHENLSVVLDEDVLAGITGEVADQIRDELNDDILTD